jgi:hypothetical protein
MSQPRTLRVGSDHVIVYTDRLIVISHSHMELWTVRSHRKTVVRFEGRDWRIAELTAVPPDATRYTLAPWEAGESEVVGVTIDYGPDYVAARDRTAMQSKHVRRVSGWLRIVAPFTGFLNARTKDRLEQSYGIDPVASTKQSVLMETFTTLGSLALVSIGMISNGFSPAPYFIIALVLAPDAAFRWDRVLAEKRPPPGFYEWVYR